MTRLLPLLLLPLLAAACSTGPGTVRLSGAETSAGSAAVTVVPAALARASDGWAFEVAMADRIAVTGKLQETEEPVIVPLSTTPRAAPLVGGGRILVGTATGGGITMQCRFRLLNPVRGADGGGSGRCEGQGRQVEFLF